MLNNTLDKPRTQLEINGKTYNTVKEACNDLGLKYNVVMAEKNRSKKTYEEVINFKLNNDRTVVIKGITYSSMHEACKENGIKYSKLKAHWDKYNEDPKVTLGDYLGLCIDGKIDLENKIKINGVYYKSVSEACRELGINECSIRTFLRRHPETGLTAEEVIEKQLNGELEQLKEDIRLTRLFEKAEQKEKALESIDKNDSTYARFITPKKIGELSRREYASLNNLDYNAFQAFLNHNKTDDILTSEQLLNSYLALPMEPYKCLEVASNNNIPVNKFKRFIMAAYNLKGMTEQEIIAYYRQSSVAQSADAKVSKLKAMNIIDYENAVEAKENTGGKVWEYKGKKYLSLNDLCDDLGIEIKKLYRLRHDYPDIADRTDVLVEFLLNQKEADIEKTE